jgi:hypothetical protein
MRFKRLLLVSRCGFVDSCQSTRSTGRSKTWRRAGPGSWQSARAQSPCGWIGKSWTPDSVVYISFSSIAREFPNHLVEVGHEFPLLTPATDSHNLHHLCSALACCIGGLLAIAIDIALAAVASLPWVRVSVKNIIDGSMGRRRLAARQRTIDRARGRWVRCQGDERIGCRVSGRRHSDGIFDRAICLLPFFYLRSCLCVPVDWKSYRISI